MESEPYFKVHNSVSVYPKSIILGQMTNLNMIFHVLVSVYRFATILNSPQQASLCMSRFATQFQCLKVDSAAKHSSPALLFVIRKTYPFLLSGLHIRLPADNLSVADHVEECDLQRLNTNQETAVKRSLRGRFTLIQGPPGTFHCQMFIVNSN